MKFFHWTLLLDATIVIEKQHGKKTHRKQSDSEFTRNKTKSQAESFFSAVELQICNRSRIIKVKVTYTVAGKAIGFALEQPLHVVALACSASRILKRLQHIAHDS
jgi:hypothetical protein